MGWNFEALELVGGRGGLVGGPSEAFRVEMVPGEEQRDLVHLQEDFQRNLVHWCPAGGGLAGKVEGGP